MKTKPGQRVAYYEVTSNPEGGLPGVEVGSILVDRPRGAYTSWEIFTSATGTVVSVTGKRLGFAVMDTEDKPQPEPKLAAILAERKAARDSA
jgi:hypothetical protein